MKKHLLIGFCLLAFGFCNFSASAQTRYLVRFRDKGTSPFAFSNPSAYLSQIAIDRRTRYNIAIDSTDLPVTPRYVDSVRLAGAVTILNTSKWLNEVAIRTTDPVALSNINNFPFVLSVTAVASFSGGTQPSTPVESKMKDQVLLTPVPQSQIPNSASFTGGTTGTAADYYSYGSVARGQIDLHQGQFLHNHNFRGQSMRISLLDGGFLRYLNIPTFDSVRLQNRIIETRDFVANETSVNEDDAHGMYCFSTIGANIPGVFVGSAPASLFALYRTEDVASETKIEEHNLAAGFERADSIGSDVVSVSLGYYAFDIGPSYTYANMNGDFTISAIAADLAAKKGMMPVVAAGNEGNNAWHYIITPADADSVLSVGATDSLGNVASFSSYGPSADGRIKPELAATGLRSVIANATTGQPQLGNGTSFATPILAGLTTCLWQAYPEFNNMTMLDAMKRAATRYNNPNDRVGYGIPDMKNAFVRLQQRTFERLQIIDQDCNYTIPFKVKIDASMHLILERKGAADLAYAPVQTKNGTGSYSVQQFVFTENLATLSSPGAAMYRVRMKIDTDTSYVLDSMSVNVTTTCVNPANNVSIKPNPVENNSANIVISRAAAGEIGLLLFNSAGQKVYELRYTQPAGSVVKTINMSGLASGTYYLHVLADGKKVETRSLLVRR